MNTAATAGRTQRSNESNRPSLHSTVQLIKDAPAASARLMAKTRRREAISESSLGRVGIDTPLPYDPFIELRPACFSVTHQTFYEPFCFRSVQLSMITAILSFALTLAIAAPATDAIWSRETKG